MSDNAGVRSTDADGQHGDVVALSRVRHEIGHALAHLLDQRSRVEFRGLFQGLNLAIFPKCLSSLVHGLHYPIGVAKKDERGGPELEVA